MNTFIYKLHRQDIAKGPLNKGKVAPRGEHRGSEDSGYFRVATMMGDHTNCAGHPDVLRAPNLAKQ